MATPSRKAGQRATRNSTPGRAAARGRGSRAKVAPARPERRTVPRRADFGASIEQHLARLAPPVRAIVEELRDLVLEAAPDATATLKWGIPWFAVDGAMFCAVAGFRTHANLILPGAPGTYADPGGLLAGEGKTGKHLKLRPGEPLPRAAIRGWLRIAVRAARGR